MNATLYNLTAADLDIDSLLDRSAANYRDHRDVLDDSPLRRVGESLQVYFW